MKKLSTLFAVFGFLFMGAANAADITLYYSPSCPHCHHARDFFTSRIVYEYPDLRIVQINVMDQANLPAFQEALKKCEYDSGGVPVIVVGDKCFQGYADFMQQELRDAVEVGMSQDQKDIAAENKKALDDKNTNPLDLPADKNELTFHALLVLDQPSPKSQFHSLP